jgi:short-subunit dehydrogenase
MKYDGLQSWWRRQLVRRPGWMNALLLFCVFMAVIYVPWDIFLKPVAVDREVWFGITFRGWAAKLAALPHWLLYALGAYGLWHMRVWMWPWAAVYTAQIAFSALLWSVLHRGGFMGWLLGIAALLPLGWITRALWRARPLFHAFRPSLRARYGEWAMVTGASSGIGAEFARALAADGLSCVLTARRESRLNDLAAELETAYGVQTRVVAADLGAPTGADRVLAAVADLEIAVLVNNAGHGYAGRFDAQDTERLRSMIQLNCVSPVVLTSRILPAMHERGRGAMIIVGSVAGRQPVPLNGVYGATKAFDLFFGESLWGEMQGSGVDVLVLEPGPTATEFQAVAGESFHEGEPPARVVGVALNALGHTPSVISGWGNWLRSNLSRLAPRSFTALAAGRVMAQWVPEEGPEPETHPATPGTHSATPGFAGKGEGAGS